MLFSNREAKAVGPVIWMDLEPTKKGTLLNFSDSIPESSQVDCVDKAWCRSCLPARLLQSICLLNALMLCLQNGKHQLSFFTCRHKRTGIIQSSTLALGIFTDFSSPEDGWNMRHCCERVVASPQVSIAELRKGSVSEVLPAGFEYLARKPL